MGLFSWCTADTRKSLAVDMNGYEDAPKKVYLLNPFGKPYEETEYEGYGVIGGVDVYAMVAKWNAPERCKDENGNWISEDEMRLIGISLACGDADHVQLKYPIKIVEKPCLYNNVGISPNCPYQGYFYPGDIGEINSDIDYAFSCLADAEKAYLQYLICDGDADKIFGYLELKSRSTIDTSFVSIAAKNENTPEVVLMEIAKKGDTYQKQELSQNKALSLNILRELEKTNDYYIQGKVKRHPNYVESKPSLSEKIESIRSDAEGNFSEKDIGKENERG